jgi:hypothetical protein
MSYLGDIRENSFGPNGELWEGDNRIEERHYWNGAFIDLCNLSAEDYAKTIFVTSGNGGANDPTIKPTNVITVEVIQVTNGTDMVYAYKAFSKYPVSSDYEIILIIEDMYGTKENIILIISDGGTSSEVVLSAVVADENTTEPIIISSNYKKEDDDFKYNVILPEKEPEKPMAYHITLKSGDLDNLSEEELRKKIIAGGEIDMKDETKSEKFKVEFTPIAVEGLENMTVIESSNALIANAQDIILVTDKPIKSIEQADVAGINEKSLWTKYKNDIIINGVTFSIWYKRDEGQTSQSRICDSANPNYVFGAEPREYIIYYE